MKNKPYPLNQVEQISNLKELVNIAANKYNDNPAFIYERKKETVSVSYIQFKADVEALGFALSDLGLHNAKAAVIGENSYEWILTYFAVINSNNVIVPLDKELPAAEIKNLIDHSEAEFFVYSDSYSDIADYLRESGTTIKHYINMNSFNELLSKYRNKKMGENDIDNKALAALHYTSGTTGVSKGVMLSHGNLAKYNVAICQSISLHENALVVLPFHHISGLQGVLGLLLCGKIVSLNLSLKNVQKDFENYKPQITMFVPLIVEVFYKKIWDGAAKQGKDKALKKLIKVSNALLKIGIDVRRKLFKSVLQAFGGNIELIVCGGAKLDENYIKRYREFGITIINVYGLTETSGSTTTNRNYYYRDGSVGQAISCCEVKIIEPDENGHGEICVKGDNVMLGYYKNEQATKEAFEDGWFKTGDIGYLDEDGFLYISGRKKNLIILSNGKNVYPEEIEFALLNFIPYVKEAVVYEDGDMIAAEVFLDTENNPDCASRLDSDIIEFNRTQPPFKNIGKTVIRDTEFPKTTTRKIKRQYK